MPKPERVPELAEGFAACSDMLTAIGDETRRHIILEMPKMPDCSGVLANHDPTVAEQTLEVNI